MDNEYQASLKSSDTEEHIDIFFYRPIGYQWARLFRKLGITPNTVTILSIILGVGAGILFGFNDIRLNIMGMLLLIWANMYDSADGQLARMTNQKTALGRILDGAAGNLWFVAIYVAIAIRLTPQMGIWIWVLASLSGFVCHAQQSRLADYYRQIHLFFLKGKAGSELADADKQVEIYRAMKWKKEPLQKFFQLFYVNYTSQQEKATPSFQILKREIRSRFPQEIPVTLRNDFRQGSLPLMKYTNILTFNWRSISLFFSLFIGMPWVYLCIEIVIFSGIYAYMHYKHEHLCKALISKLDTYEK